MFILFQLTSEKIGENLQKVFIEEALHLKYD